MVGSFQIIRSKNTPSGIPRTVIVVYTHDIRIHSIVEVFTSMTSNYEGQLRKAGFHALMTVFVQPKEFMRIKRDYKHVYLQGS